jgi:hypothetical protein
MEPTMIRKRKIVGLALVVCFAISVFSSAGRAAEFHSSVEHTAIAEAQIGNVAFTVGGGFGNITCEVAKWSGTSSSKTATSVVLVPTYEGCKESAFGSAATFTCIECNIIETSTGLVHFTGEEVWHLGTGCTITKKGQTVEGITYHNIGPNEKKTIDITNVIIETTEGGFFACGVSNGEHKEGSFSGEVTVTGTTTTGESVTLSFA